MNQIITTKQFSLKQYSSSNKNQSLSSLERPIFGTVVVSLTFYGKNIEILKL